MSNYNLFFSTGIKVALTNPNITNIPYNIYKKKNLYGDQSSSFQVDKTVKTSYGVKDSRKTNSHFSSSYSVRAGGVGIPPKRRQYNDFMTDNL